MNQTTAILISAIRERHVLEQIILLGEPSARARCKCCLQGWPCDARRLVVAIGAQDPTPCCQLCGAPRAIPGEPCPRCGEID